MNYRKYFIVFLILALTTLIISINYKRESLPLAKNYQNHVIWVWERPENLYFLDKENLTFAYLAGTATKTDNEIVLYPRKQPLRIPTNSETITVVRVEDMSTDGFFNDEDLKEISSFVSDLCTQPDSDTCQIDFDAKESQLDFYKKLLLSLKNELPKDKKISITALLSWCVNINEPWFSDAPVDEVVPMFFQLGVDEIDYWQKIDNNDLKLNKQCTESIGVSTNDKLPSREYLLGKRIYIFNNEYWNEENWKKIKTRLPYEN